MDNKDLGALPQADRACALRAEPQASQAKPLVPSAGFLLKAWDITVSGYGTERIVAASRGAALAQAWRCDAFSGISFGQFLKIASAWRAIFIQQDFGQPITVNGKPAFFVGCDRQYVRFAYPFEKSVFNVHPSEVEPQRFRPERYRTAKAIEARRAATGTGAVHESAVATPFAQDLSDPQTITGEAG